MLASSFPVLKANRSKPIRSSCQPDPDRRSARPGFPCVLSALPLSSRRRNVWLSLQAVCVHVMFFVKSEGWIDMDHKQFQEWLSGIDHLSPAQRQQTEAVFLGDTETSASLAAIEAAVGGDRQCPHCGTLGAISRGKARGLRRYQCKGCRKTLQCRDRHPLVGSAPQGQVAFLRSLSC